MKGLNVDSNQFRLTKGLILIMLFIYLVINFSGLYDLLIVNASKYAQVGREIIDNHDWINLTIAHEPYDQKPPLLFWIGALSYSLFGVSQFAFKIPVLLFSLIGIYSTYKLGAFLYTKKVGGLAAFLWATSLGYFYFHNDIHTDTLLVNFVILAIWQLAAFLRDKKWYQFLIGIIAIGLAMLTKGPIGLAIPVFGLGTHLLLQKKYKEIFHVRWLLAAVLILIIITPALMGLYNQFGISGIKFYFWTNNVGRITGEYRSSSSDVFYYFHNLILLTTPWFMFVYPGIFLETRKYILKLVKKEKLQDSDETINLGGFILFFIVLTIARQKNPHYLIALLPLVMIIASKWTLMIFESDRFIKLKKAITIVNHIFPILIWPLVLVFMLWFYPEKRAWFWTLFFISTVGFIFFFLKSKGLRKQLTFLLIAQFVFFISLNISIMPSMFNYYSTFKACEIFNAEAEKNEILHSYRLRYWSLFTNSNNYGYWIRDDEKMKEVLKQGNSWIFTDEAGLNALNIWNAEYTVKGEFNHRNITGQSFKFLNPKTRDQHFKKYYLIKLE